MPTLRQLRQFLIAAEVESLTKAAALLGTVPSALSAQITALEAALGCALFRRDGRGVHPTEQGLELMGHARRILDAARELKDEIAQPARAIAGEVRLGLLPWLCRPLLPRLVAEARTRYPALSLALRDGSSGDLAEALAAGGLDLASLFAAEARPEHRAIALREEALCLVGLSLPAAPLSFAAAASRPLIVESRRHGLRLVLEQAALEAGIALRVAAEVDSDIATITLLEAGIGSAILPAPLAREAAATGRLAAHPIADAPRLPIVLARSAQNRHSAAAAAITRLVQELSAAPAS
jgi:LysR family transcriptional regulator, nitrogen assimilation regulatory protein